MNQSLLPDTSHALNADSHQRVGVIDVGSNSVRLVVFDGPLRAPSYFFNEKVLCGLGSEISHTGRLSGMGRVRALEAIGRFTLMAERMRLDRLIGIATAAVRDAEDGPEFVEAVKLKTGLVLRVASGAEEGRLSAQGVLMGMPDAEGLVVDMGGSSMEVARVTAGQVGLSVTSALGPLALAGLSASHRQEVIARQVGELRTAHPDPVERLYLVGGSWRAIAGLEMARQAYPLPVLQGYRLSPKRAASLAKWIATKEVAEMKALVSTSSARLALLSVASEVLAAVNEVFAPRDIIISAFGLREGAIFDRMDQQTRKADPLIVSAEASERAHARFPGFGRALEAWLQPVTDYVAPDRARLVAAATRLHDVHWQAHPDVRRQHAFEAMCRANLAGIDHPGRLFIAATLAQRYKTGTEDVSAEVLGLLPEAEQKQAAALGRAIRLGAMLTGGCADALADTRLEINDTQVALHLGPQAEPLMGEVAEKRLQRFAKELGLLPVVARH